MTDRNPLPGIKQIPGSIVKLSSFVAVITALAHPFPVNIAYADEPATQASPEPSPDETEETLPDIEAKTFNVKVMRRSRSGRVYVFQTEDSQPLHTGKILLLKQGEQPVMAFRVLRDYSEKNQFAAKWVRRYGGIEKIEPSQSYVAIEKIADREAPPLTPQEKEELKEVETELPPPPGEKAAPQAVESPPPLPEQPSPTPSAPSAAETELPPPAPAAKNFDTELDSTTSPPPKAAAESENPELTPADEEEIDELRSIVAQELVPLERESNGVTAGFAYFRNNGSAPGQSSGYNSGFDVKYARTLQHLIYLKRKDIQDSIVLEGSTGYYKLISFAALNDSYTVVPLTVTARYNVLFGSDLVTFMYAGLNKNFVATSTVASPGDASAANTATNQLNSVLPAIGVGTLFRVGPSWYIRLDAGLDQIGLSLHLRF